MKNKDYGDLHHSPINYINFQGNSNIVFPNKL